MKFPGTIILAAVGIGCLWGLCVNHGQKQAIAATPAAQSSTSPIAVVTISQTSESKPSQWGNLTGRFLYGGEPPAPVKLELNKDVDVCSPFEPHAEQLLVNKENQGLANVVLWLEMPGRGQVPPIHESYAKTAKQEVVITNQKCQFSPHVTLLRTSQKLSLKNEDTIPHNTSAALKRNLPFNVVTPPGTDDQRSVRKAERKPLKISCSIHAWMTGWLLVQDHPYMAVTDAEGRFKIENLPVGEWTFQVWHEIPQAITAASKNGKKTAWKQGEVTVTIQKGENEFGEWTLAPQLFQ